MRFLPIIIALLLIPGVLAIGISPAQQSIGPDDAAFTFRPISDTPVNVRVEGDLRQYIVLEKATIAPGEEIKGRITLPADIAPGTHEQHIVITTAASEGGTVGAAAEVAGSLLIKIPYPAEYLDASWAITNDGPVTLMTVTLENLGSKETIPQVTIAVADDTIIIPSAPLPAGEFGKLEARYTRAIPGEYDAILNVKYTDKMLTKSQSYAFGTPQLAVTSLTYNDESGDIKPIDISGTTGWNKDLNLNLAIYIDNSATPALQETFIAAPAFSHRAYLSGVEPSTLRAVITSGTSSAEATAETAQPPTQRNWTPFVVIAAIILVVGALLFWWRSKAK